MVDARYSTSFISMAAEEDFFRSDRSIGSAWELRRRRWSAKFCLNENTDQKVALILGGSIPSLKVRYKSIYLREGIDPNTRHSRSNCDIYKCFIAKFSMKSIL